MIRKIIAIALVSCSLVACTEKKETVSLDKLAETAQTFVTKIKAFEAKIDPTNIDTFMQLNDSIAAQQTLADSAIAKVFATGKDTLFLEFAQTKNLNRIKVLKVWVTGAKYNELEIEALVEAIDNSSFKGPYTSATIFDNTGKRMEVGGGIGGDPETKLEVGKTYKFKGIIDNLNLLKNLKKLNFDEDIKKW